MKIPFLEFHSSAIIGIDLDGYINNVEYFVICNVSMSVRLICWATLIWMLRSFVSNFIYNRITTYYKFAYINKLFLCYFSGILRDKTIADKFMYIPNDYTKITSSVDYY